MADLLFKGARLINEGKIITADLLVQGDRIAKIAPSIDPGDRKVREINCDGQYLIPGIIDDQVHFREPGLTNKSDLYTEPRAAVAGGTTSYMEMPNTKPPAVTQERLAEKYAAAATKSLSNYSFFMGASNDNLDEVLRTDSRNVCGVKIFMGSSTGNMLVDETEVLKGLFREVPMLIATHCEDEDTVRRNMAEAREQYGEDVPIELHPEIRSIQACVLSSTMAIKLAREYDTRLHILHISTEEETHLFRNDIPLTEKRITSEACVHHLYFNASQYDRYGSQIKCNPAIKGKRHQDAILAALLDDRIDIIATDHAPHTWDEKQQTYFKSPSGVPLVQHSLQVMLEFYHQGKITLERMVEKMCHAPAQCFKLEERGYLREGYKADLVLVDVDQDYTITKDNIYHKCKWSPFEGHTFRGAVRGTVVSGHLAYFEGQFDESQVGQRLTFEGV